MEELLKKIDGCSDKATKYDLTIEYMENAGIVFATAQKDHLNLKYRILTNGSSIFVYVDHFKMNLCDSDRDKVEKALGLSFSTNYKDKGRDVIDRVRPWTCEFSGASMLEKVVGVLLDKVQIQNINYPTKPLKVVSGMVHCPNCTYVFEKANRCPECGQLMDYNNVIDMEAVGDSFRKKYRSQYEAYVEERTTRERAEKGKGPLKSLSTIISDTFAMEDIDTSKPFSYWIGSDDTLEEAKEILIREFTKRKRKNPETDAAQYIRDMKIFRDFYNSLQN